MLFLIMLFLDVNNLVHFHVAVLSYLILICIDGILGEFIYRVVDRKGVEQ